MQNKLNFKFDDLKGKNAKAFEDVPEFYFENLHRKLMQDIYVSAKTNQLVHWRLAIAATILILFTSGALLLVFSPDWSGRKGHLAIKENSKGTNETLDETIQPTIRVAETLNLVTGKNHMMPLENLDASNENQLNLEITLEDITLYLIEKEEFEF